MKHTQDMDPPTRCRSKERPFYLAPENKTTSSDIINEARISLRTLRTSRPFTPRDEKRTLFGSSSTRNPETRPPSAFSLGSHHFDGSDSRPVSGTRLSPLDRQVKQFSPTEIERELLPPKPPVDPNRAGPRRSSGRTRIVHSPSADSVGHVREAVRPSCITRSESLTGVSENNETVLNEAGSVSKQRSHSSPKERVPVIHAALLTPLSPEERGEGDGTEMPARVASSAGVYSPPTSAGLSRAGSGGSSRKQSTDDSPEDKQIYTNHIAPLLENMIAIAKKRDTDQLLQLTDQLHCTLDKRHLLGRVCKQRSAILKTVYKLLDGQEPKVLLRLASLILSLKVTGNNLTSVCKLIFKVSRSENNDTEFLNSSILDLIIETVDVADQNSATEALVYCVGGLKFLTGNTSLCKQLAKKGCVEALAALLQRVCNANIENGRASEPLGNILVQLTAALRNLADIASSREKFLTGHILQNLCHVMEMYTMDSDLMLNISRVLSKVTLHTDCCACLTDQLTCYKSFVAILNKHMQKQDLIVRVCFVLGNLTAKNDDARYLLYQESRCIDTLLQVFTHYLQVDAKVHNGEIQSNSVAHTNDGSLESKFRSIAKEERPDVKDTASISGAEDVLIKLVRVIANLSINETVGPSIASSEKCVDLLIKVIDLKQLESSEELVLNAVATVNNLSYFSPKHSAIISRQIHLADSLLKLLLPHHMDSLVEAARVFGNLTRQKTVRDHLFNKKVAEMMIALLDSGNREVVYIACGVLINFLADEEKRPLLKHENGITKLVDVLRDLSRGDWQLGGLVCQLLWNYSSKLTCTNACFGATVGQELADILIELLDADSAFPEANGQLSDEVHEFVQTAWESDFCPVASQLLQRIEHHQTDLEPLDPSSS